MKVLLDENFPPPLFHHLRSLGIDAEHIITLGLRGLPDSEIRKRLAQEEIIFLTQDTEFETLALDFRSIILISRLPQNLPIGTRIEIWTKGIKEFLAARPAGKLFYLLETGQIAPWQIH